ncbi:MAG: S41 family peptidase [Gammaproteobacteria bacterium]
MGHLKRLRVIGGVLLMGVTGFACGLTPAEVGTDVRLAQDAFERVHPGYERYTSAASLTTAWQTIIDDADAADGMSVEALYLRLQAVLAMIRCDHTKAELPKAMSQARKTDPVYLPLRYTLVNGRALVLAVAPDLGIAVGDEILAIDGMAMAELIARYAPLIPVDGFTEHAREDELADSREFPGGGIEHFMALAGVAPTASLLVKQEQGVERTVTVSRIGLTAQRELAAHLDGASDFADSVTLDVQEDGVAILRVDSFINYRNTVDPDELFGPIFRSINAANVRHLIVDLRRNGGGSNDARDSLFAHLITKRASIVRESQIRTLDLSGLREHVSTWEKRALNPSRLWFKKLDDRRYRLRSWMIGIRSTIRPARDAYEGKLTVLTSTGNSSGSAMMIGALQGVGRARLVGERTGGNLAGSTAGTLFFLKLPDSEIVLRLPVLRSVTGYDEDDRGLGIVPDVLVEPTFEDVRAGRDVVLNRALLED